jgi:hypothetical protein
MLGEVAHVAFGGLFGEPCEHFGVDQAGVGRAPCGGADLNHLIGVCGGCRSDPHVYQPCPKVHKKATIDAR